MVFICEAAECYAHTSKQKNLVKYPWMMNIKWVKWPKNCAAIKRWKRLVRREGKTSDGSVIDQLNITRRSRLCSRHFDPEDIDMWGNARSDPKYFKWNNWGNPINPRNTETLVKLAAARQPSLAEATSCTENINMQGSNWATNVDDDDLVPEIGTEVDIAGKSIHKNNIGRKLQIK